MLIYVEFFFQDSNNERNRPGSGSMRRISPTNTLSIVTNRQHQKQPQQQQHLQNQNQISEHSHSTNASSPPPPSTRSPNNTVERNSRGNNGNGGKCKYFLVLQITTLNLVVQVAAPHSTIPLPRAAAVSPLHTLIPRRPPPPP